MANNTRCVFVAVVGEPNAGKSTLVNAVVGEKVSIVSPKIQTTRKQIRGITEIEETQLVFTDTPGFCKPNTPLEKIIELNFKNSYKDSDIILLVIDASSKHNQPSLEFMEKLKLTKIPFSVVINKVDIARREDILKLASKINAHGFIKKVFMISALNNDGLEDLKAYLQKSAPESPWFFEKNTPTDSTLLFRLSEITREKVFNHLDKELPYSIYIETEQFHESEKKARINQSIVVMKDSQKGIVLGKNGTMIKRIKNESIWDMKKLLNKNIDLKLFVKVKEKWSEKRVHLQNAGIID